MNRFLFLPLFFILALIFPAEINAQATLKCEESGSHTIEIPVWLCYFIEDFDRFDDIIDQARFDLESVSLSCDASVCLPNPAVFHCDAEAEVTSFDVERVEEDGYFCFKGSYDVDWSCSMCRRDTIKPTEPKELPGRIPLRANENYQPFSFTQVEVNRHNQNKLIKIYPNPSEGIFNTQLNIENSGSAINLIITAISGKVVLQKDYLDVPSGVLNTQQDLSELPNGLYLLSIKIDGEIISTNKLTIQHSF